MASLEKRNGIYRVVFRFNGEKFGPSLRTRCETEAKLGLAKVEDGLRRLKAGLMHLEPNDDIVAALLSAGQPRKQPAVVTRTAVGKILDDYLNSVPAGSIEESTRGMLRTHIRNLKRVLGERLAISRINLAKLQEFVNTRSMHNGTRGKKLSPVTVRKEITTFYAAWLWAKESKLVSFDLPRKARLRYSKQSEKPVFNTWDGIQRIIKKSNLTESQQREHWDCLFLDSEQISELINDLKTTSTPNSIRTMLTTAAFTGMRRSELLRCQVSDIDLEIGKITIREKKRVRSKHSFRSVPICEVLKRSLTQWLNVHPGGPFAFTIGSDPVTRDQAYDFFVKALEDTKWKVLGGWHVLRHSFISNCASQGVDQRMIDDWVGHQTEDMRRRYRHLLPNVQQSAIDSVFA